MKAVFALSTVCTAIDLATFDDASNWKTLIDPVMGGQSVATATVESGHGILDGEVKIVPALQAPGFITAQADMKVDASSAEGGDLVLKVRTTTPDYDGFKVSFAASTLNPTLSCASGGSIAFSRGCFKAPFSVPAGDDFVEVRIPLNDFSDKWDAATGQLTTLCKDDADVCPKANKLKKVQRVAIWGEGSAGKVHIELDSITLEPASKLGAAASDITLATFDGKEEASAHEWQQQNDPVMGGASSGSFSIDENGNGVMNGTVALIPKLQAPGFIKMQTTDSKAWPDVSTCTGLSLTLKSTSTPSPYKGYRVAFGSDSAFLKCGKFFARGYKADFTSPEGDFGTVQVPFDMFSKCWDDSTGDAIKTCKDYPEFCPSQERLKSLQTMSIWAEGAAGDVKLEVKSVGAYGCSGTALV